MRFTLGQQVVEQGSDPNGIGRGVQGAEEFENPGQAQHVAVVIGVGNHLVLGPVVKTEDPKAKRVARHPANFCQGAAKSWN